MDSGVDSGVDLLGFSQVLWIDYGVDSAAESRFFIGYVHYGVAFYFSRQFSCQPTAPHWNIVRDSCLPILEPFSETLFGNISV